MAISVISLIILGETLFDSNQKNDARMWMLAIPVSIFLILESILDALTTWNTKDEKKIIFYSLQNGMKTVWVIGHIVATFVYCACLFYWLWIFENNDKT
jgi:hypothetical protein